MQIFSVIKAQFYGMPIPSEHLASFCLMDTSEYTHFFFQVKKWLNPTNALSSVYHQEYF